MSRSRKWIRERRAWAPPNRLSSSANSAAEERTRTTSARPTARPWPFSGNELSGWLTSHASAAAFHAAGSSGADSASCDLASSARHRLVLAVTACSVVTGYCGLGTGCFGASGMARAGGPADLLSTPGARPRAARAGPGMLPRGRTPLDRWQVRREFSEITKAAGLGEDWTPRELRHSFVSILSASDVPLEDISQLVGHVSTSVTETVYRHEIRPALTKGAAAMDKICKKKRKSA